MNTRKAPGKVRQDRHWSTSVLVGIGLTLLLGTGLNAQVSTNARTGRFARGTTPVGDPHTTYQSFVIALDSQKGVPLDDIGGNATNLFPQPYWTELDLAHYDATKPASSTNLSERIHFQNPIVAFGERVGGSPLYVGQRYHWGAYAGWDETNAPDITIYAISRTNAEPVDWLDLTIPNYSQTNAWYKFGSNGFTKSITGYGLRTTAYRVPDEAWGVPWPFCYVLTHEADSSATNYIFMVSISGYTDCNWLVLDSDEAPVDSFLYTLEFTARSPGRSVFIDSPQFEGQPLPSDYAGKDVQELTNLTVTVTNQVWLTNDTFSSVDLSPELRRHGALNKLVSDLRNDPLALTAYVLNEIDLTDPMAYGEVGQVASDSINYGGVNRGALATFRERQGSPVEQCALLVYLLRQAGYPAAYVFPTNSNLKLLDSCLSKLLRMQMKGAVSEYGNRYTTNSLITVNYPWVVANIGTRCVHIFPWLKDTEVVEGLNLYDYMPTNYDSGFKWVRDYLYGNTNILGLSTDSDVPRVLFPKFIETILLTNAPGVSLDDIGTRAYNRRVQYSRWEDLPKPNFLTNQTQATVVADLSLATTNFPWMTNLFDTIKVQVYRPSDLNNPVLGTGRLRMCDVHNRRFLLFTNSGKLTLWLEPFRSGTTNQSSFGTSDPTLTNKQVLQTNLLAGDSQFRVRMTYQRHRWSLNPYQFPGLEEAHNITNESTFVVGDVSGICFNIGRVTQPMVQVHAENYWRTERTKQGTPTYVPAVEDYQGVAAYLLGMGYFEKQSRFDEINQRLHKVRIISQFGAGLAMIKSKTVGGFKKIQPVVDMQYLNTVVAMNNALRPDAANNFTTVLQNYAWLAIANGSAEEHNSINKSFRETNAISTVGLLRLAQQRATTNREGILQLNASNYVARGNQPSAGYNPNTLLKNYDPAAWAAVSNAFQDEFYADHTWVFITPASITNYSGSYTGMGTLIFAPLVQSALITPLLNGASGSLFPEMAVPSGDIHEYLPYMLYDMGNGEDFAFFFNDPNAAQFRPVLATAALPTFHATSLTLEASPDQSEAAQRIASLLNLNNQPYQNLVQAGAEAGVLSGDDWVRSRNGFLADPVNTLTGEFYIDAADLTLPGPMPLQIRRNYLSHNRMMGAFGAGWKLSYVPHLVLTTNATGAEIIYAAEMDGSVVAYRRTNDLWVPKHRDNRTLNNNSTAGVGGPANLFNARIERVITNNVENYLLTSPDGSVRRFQTNAYPFVSGTNSQNSLTRQRPYLLDWRDSRGNFYAFTYGTDPNKPDYGELVRIQSSSGSFVGFSYDAYGRIVEAFTGDGRRLYYGYDDYGDLVSVMLPDASQVNYKYQHYTFTLTNQGVVTSYIDSKHLLTREFKPDGRVLRNEYDDQRRVTNQWATVGPDLSLVPNARFIYSNDFNLTNAPTNGYSGFTVVFDVNGHTNWYGYTNSCITNIIDALGQTSFQEWYFPGDTNAGAYQRSLKRVIDQRGLTNTFLYDAQGNLTNLTRAGDLTGDGHTQAVTSITYTTNNLPLLMVDAMGNQVQQVYDSNFTYLVAQTIFKAGATPVWTNVFEYYSVTSAVSNGTLTFTNFAAGLPRRQVRAANSPDAAVQEWTHDGRGFISQSVRYTGTNDPNVTNVFFYSDRGELIEQTDAAGRRTRLDYDGLGRLKAREVYEANGTVPVSWEYAYYNANGELVWSDGPRFDPEDYVWRDYDQAGRKIQEIHWRSQAKTDGSGVEAPLDSLSHRMGEGQGEGGLYTISFFYYDPFGNLTNVVDPRGNYSLKQYDALGRLTREQFYDTSGTLLATNGVAYGPGGEVTNAFNALGALTETRYTSTGQPFYRRNPDGSTNAWRYHLDGRVRRETQPNGAYWETSYDDANRRATTAFYSAAGTALATNSSESDRRGNLIKRTDETRTNVWINIYDGLDRIKVAAGPAIRSSPATNAPPPPGGSSGASTTNQQLAIYTYDASGQVLTVANAFGEKTITTRDALGRPVRVEVQTANGATVRVTETGYATNHHSLTVWEGTGANAIPTTTCTDHDGRAVLAIRYPASGVQEYTWNRFDLAGNRIESRQYSRTNSAITLWATNAWSYDGLSRVVTEAVRDGASTTFGYDAAGNLTSRAMPGGLTWNAAYTEDGRLLREWDSGSGGSTGRGFTNTYYGPERAWAGRLWTVTDGRGVTRTNTYDQFLRLASVTTTGAVAEAKMVLSCQYDVRGLLTNLTQGFASTNTGPDTVLQRSYDAYGNILSESVLIGGVPSRNVGQGWDSAGRRTVLSLSGAPSGFVFDYRADGLMTKADGATFGYADNGLLTGRTNALRTMTVTSRDGAGRRLAASTKVGLSNVLSETLAWRGDGLLTDYTASRTDFIDTRHYGYAPWSRRLTNESLYLGDSQPLTTSYTYDRGEAAQLGVMTAASQSSSLAPGKWGVPSGGGLDGLQRVVAETNTVVRRTARGQVNGPATLRGVLNNRPLAISYDPTKAGQWTADLELASGTNTLTVYADHPSGWFTTNATSVFTNMATSDTATNQHDGVGNVIARVWRNGTNGLVRTQSLTWDAFHRLARLTERDAQNHGYDWTATFDGLGRRARTLITLVSNNVATATNTLVHYYDPQVEFLEVGVSVNGVAVWKLYGPDGDAPYGSQQGLGGLEVLLTGIGESIGLLQDHFGNVLGSVTNTMWAWNASRLSGYGPVDGLGVPALASTALTPEHLAWRGKWREVTGDYYWGARPYDAKRRGFLSADPLGHGSDPALYGFCGGDAINFWDPDGRGKNPAFEQDPVGGLLASMNQLNAAENSLIQLLAGAMAQGQADTVNGINAQERARNLAARQWNQAWLSRSIDQYVNSVAQAGQREAAGVGWLANMQAASDAAGPGPELSLQQRWTSYVSSGRAAEQFEMALKETAMLSVTVVAGGLPGAGVRAGLAAGERGVLRGAAETGARAPMTGYTWNQVFQARYGAANVEWVAPKMASEPLTLGVLRTPAGEFELASGWNGYGGLMPKGASGFDIVTRTHVEGQAAALMQKQGINEGLLYINNPAICPSCTRNLPYMLGPGRSLQVVPLNGVGVPFTGH